MHDTLIVRLPNWLGDTVMSVPALRALRAAEVDRRVALVGPWATLLAGQDLADVLVPYPRSWTGRLARWDSLRALRAGTIVLLPNSLEAALAAWYWGGRRRVGFATDGRRRLLTDPIASPEEREHQIDEYLRVVETLIGIVGERVPWLRPPAAESDERAAAQELLRVVGIAVGEDIVGIHLGAAYGSSKLWPPARIVECCHWLTARGRRPLLLGSRADADVARRIVAETSVASLVGRDNLEILPALLTELDVLVCGDTGVGHLAAALGTAVVALFGPTDPRLSAPRGRVRVASHAVACAPCFYRTCPIEHPCLRGVTADEVGAAIDDVGRDVGRITR